MRIGIDARLWNETGVGRYTRNLIKNLLEIDKQNEYVLFVLSSDADSIQKQIASVLPKGKWQIVAADIRWHSVAEQREFPKILTYANLDLMHFPYFSVPVLYTKPFIVTIHDLILHHYSTGEASTLPFPIYKLKHNMYKHVVASAARKAKKIFTVSEATKKEIVEHLNVPADKVVVTYEGIALAKGKGQRAKRFGEKFFLHVGNVYPHKNANRLVEAFEVFSKTHPDVSLVFAGREDYFMKKLQAHVESLRIKNVEFLGEVTDDTLQNLYEEAIALVSPSLMEGFGLPAVEALAQKCLVLVSDIPSYREVVGEAGIYFNPKHISDIAEKLMNTYSMSHDDKARRIAAGIAKVKKYSWEKMAHQTVAVYESCFSLRQS